MNGAGRLIVNFLAQSVLRNPPVDRKTLNGPEIRRARLRIGWSREQLGHQIGVDSDTISLWEQGSLEVSCPIVLEQVLRSAEPSSRYASRDAEAEVMLHGRTN